MQCLFSKLHLFISLNSIKMSQIGSFVQNLLFSRISLIPKNLCCWTYLNSSKGFGLFLLEYYWQDFCLKMQNISVEKNVDHNSSILCSGRSRDMSSFWQSIVKFDFLTENCSCGVIRFTRKRTFVGVLYQGSSMLMSLAILIAQKIQQLLGKPAFTTEKCIARKFENFPSHSPFWPFSGSTMAQNHWWVMDRSNRNINTFT